MKQTKLLYNTLLFILMIAVFPACTDNFEEINRKPYEVTAEEMERDGYNIGASLIGMQNFIVPTQVHIHQFAEALAGGEYGGYIAHSTAWKDGNFATFNPPSDWNRAQFNTVIGEFYPYYNQMQALTDDEVSLALAELFRVAAMVRVSDVYGPIPYSKIGQSESGAALTSPYDSQEDAYKSMLAGLNEAIATLTENRYTDASYYAKYDNVYAGVIEKWVKFANSLKLRMAIRMSYVEPTLAKQTAEEAVGHEIGVFASNADNAIIQVTENPWYLQVDDWGDARANADITSYMNGYADPRREKYFTASTLTGGPYIGIRGGRVSPSKEPYLPFSGPISGGIAGPVLLMNAAEVAFLKAEGALRGWNMGGTAEALYNEGITLSFAQHNVSGATDYLNNSSNMPAAYTFPLADHPEYNFASRSSITIKWDNAATDEQKLERIITQKWIAIFPLGNEAWAEFRRTGYPKLSPVVTNYSGGTVGDYAKRQTFPDTEYQQNDANVADAVRMLGGPDTQGTKLWWDKKN